MKAIGRALGCVGIGITTLLVLGGCTTTVKVPLIRPAEINLNVGGSNKVAIGAVEGNLGASLSDHLTSRLLDSGRFEVVDRQNMGRILSEHQLNLLGVVDSASAATVGKMTGAGTLLFLKSNLDYDTRRWQGKSKNQNGQVRITYHIDGIAKINTSFRVVDLATGRVLAAKVITEEARDTSWDHQLPAPPDEDAIVAKAAAHTLDRIMEMIAPYREVVNVSFKNSKIPEVKTGINLAKQGMWHDALAEFRLAVQANPADPEAKYCLGVAYEYTHQFDEAIAAIMEANRIKPCNRYAAEIINVRRLQGDLERLEKQGVESAR